MIAKTKVKYFSGVTNETSEYLYDWLSHKLANPPKTPTNTKRNRSKKSGIFQPQGIEKKLASVIAIEKKSEINQTGSVVDNCLMLIAT